MAAHEDERELLVAQLILAGFPEKITKAPPVSDPPNCATSRLSNVAAIADTKLWICEFTGRPGSSALRPGARLAASRSGRSLK
jgi:hypothetical protein